MGASSPSPLIALASAKAGRLRRRVPLSLVAERPRARCPPRLEGARPRGWPRASAWRSSYSFSGIGLAFTLRSAHVPILSSIIEEGQYK